MESMTYGVLPERAGFVERCEDRMPYPMKIVDPDEWSALESAINVGIDAHLEAIACEETGPGRLTIEDAGSMHTLLRRLIEASESEDWSDGPPAGLDLASAILSTLGYEWI